MSALELRPMTDDEIQTWMANAVERFAQERIRAGEPPEVARQRSREQHEKAMPGGRPEPENQFLTLEDGGTRVGSIWLGPHPQRADEKQLAWIKYVEVDEEQRGKGYGRAILELTEDHLRAQGVTELQLNVFGFNETARQLYRRTGFRELYLTMGKSLA